MSTKHRVAIVGGGPAGLASLRAFLAHPDTKGWDVVLFERRSEVGGVWNCRQKDEVDRDDGFPQSPIYDSLTTNLPHPVMAFNGYWFPRGTNLYPKAQTVQEYLLQYVEELGLRSRIRLGTRVVDAKWDGELWTLTFSTSEENEAAVHLCDHLVVANGHYHVPKVPSIPGLDRRKVQVMHSTWYREPSPFKGLRSVLVVGGGPSGQDISAEVSTVVESVFISVRGYERDDAFKPMKRAEIERFDGDTVWYVDGTKDEGIEKVVFATGYKLNLPFLSTPPPQSPPSPLPEDLQITSHFVHPLARHIFPLSRTNTFGSVAFIGLPVRVAPFALCEDQAILAAQVFSHPQDTLNVEEEKQSVLRRWKDLLEREGKESDVERVWHRLPGLEQFEYRKELLSAAGWSEWGVEQWIVDAYVVKDSLRATWRELERRGEAEDWVKGVEGREGWRRVLERLSRRAGGHGEEELPDKESETSEKDETHLI